MPCTWRGARVTLSSTVRCGNRLKLEDHADPLAHLARVDERVGDLTPVEADHAVVELLEKQLRQRGVVDLPEPDDPIRQTTWCLAMVRSM